MTTHIEPLNACDLHFAKAVIRDVCLEVFGHEPAALDDMDQVPTMYTPPSGIFLVLRDGPAIVGTGGIRRLDDSTCELKRMWFLPAYRGRGLGRAMAERLLEFAKTAGYERVRLDTSRRLVKANALYARLGFTPIARYNDGPASIFLEKFLGESITRVGTPANRPSGN